jgi:hypothetical protein
MELTGFASASSFFGAGLATCAANQKLQYTSGTFTCVADYDTDTTNSNIPFLTIGNTSSLSLERAIAVSSPLKFTDGGADASYTIGLTSNSLDFDEFVNAMTLDAATSIALNSFTLNMGGLLLSGTNASVSALGTFEAALVKATTIDSDSNLVQITANATVSGNLEVTGYASASATFGSGLTNCTSSNNFLQWNSSTGRFSCGTATGSGTSFNGIGVREGVGTFSHISSLSFLANSFNVSYLASTAFIGLDYTNGPASRSIAESITAGWEFQNGASFSTLSINVAPITFTGNGRPTRDITLVPEYAGATMSSISGSCTTCIGLMTSDNEIVSPYRNYYKWRTSQVASQSYDIWVKVDLPNDFSSFSSISIEGFRSSTNDRVYFAIFDTANSQSGSTTGKGTSVATSNGAWTTATVTAPAGTYTAGQSVTFRIRMEANQNQNVRVGKIRMEYLSSF